MAFGHVVAMASVVGACVALTTPLPALQALALFVGATSLRLLVRRAAAATVCVVVAVGAGAAAHASWVRERTLAPSDDPALRFLVAEGQSVELDTQQALHVTGRLLADARPSSSGGALLRLDVMQIADARGARPVRLRVQAHVAGERAAQALTQWTRGRVVGAPMTLRAAQTWRNPGGASPRRQALLRGFHAPATVKSAWLVTVVPAAWWHEGAAAVRRHVRETVRTLVEDAQAGAIVTAILIGDRAGLDPLVEQRLQKAGTYHVIAISGGNIVILCGVVLFAFRALMPRSPGVPVALTMVAIAAYGWMVGGEPSVTRAVTAACVYLACQLAGLVTTPASVLALVALLVVWVDPLTVLQPGAWLSFGATAGILAGAARIASALSAPTKCWRRLPRECASWALAILATTLAVEAVLLPISASVFARVGIAGLALNFLAIPATIVVQLAGLAAVLFWPWWPVVASASAAIAAAGVSVLVEPARLVELVPWLSWDVPPPPVPVVCAFYVAAVTGWVARREAVRRAGIAVAVLLLLVILTSPVLEWRAPPRGSARLTMLDVGQGEALLLQTGGHALLVDAGGGSATFDVGRRVIAPALWALGVRRLDYLAITHPDLDHIGGAATVAAMFRPAEIWEGVPVPGDPERRTLRGLAHTQGIAWRQLQRGDRVEFGALSVHVLHPPLPDWERPRGRNDDSLVLQVRAGLVELLLAGDIGAAVEESLPLEPARRALRVLKIAHHGSRSSSTASLLDRYAPLIGIVSAGAGNRFGHPAPEVVRRLDLAGVHLWRTDRDGAITIETDGRSMRVRTWTGTRWVARLLGARPP